MANYLLLFRSLTSAQRAERILRKQGISAFVARVPGNIPTSGCGYCIKIEEKWLKEALEALKSSDMNPTKIYAWFSSGNFKEV